MNKNVNNLEQETRNLVDKAELNLWKRGFTPQAEIWNGRMAIAGLIILSTIFLASNLIFSG